MADMPPIGYRCTLPRYTETYYPWTKDQCQAHGTVTAHHGSGSVRVTVTLDDGTVIENVPIGCIDREFTPEEAALARANMRAAGFTFGTRTEWGTTRWFWWRTSTDGGGHGWSVNEPTETDPEPVHDGIIEQWGIVLPDCRDCGLRIPADRASSGLCFTCWFWLEKTRWPKGESIRVRDTAGVVRHFHVRTPGIRGGDTSGLGFGGMVYRFQMDDGRLVVSNDVFTQGIVPERFWDRLPPNATIVRDKAPE